jgi:hypothetical protein
MIIDPMLTAFISPLNLIVLGGRILAARKIGLPFDPLEEILMLMQSPKQRAKYTRIGDKLRLLMPDAGYSDKILLDSLNSVLTFMMQWSPLAADYIKRNELTTETIQEPQHVAPVVAALLSDFQLWVSQEIVTDAEPAFRDDNMLVQLLKQDSLPVLVLPELDDPRVQAMLTDERSVSSIETSVGAEPFSWAI